MLMKWWQVEACWKSGWNSSRQFLRYKRCITSRYVHHPRYYAGQPQNKKNLLRSLLSLILSHWWHHHFIASFLLSAAFRSTCYVIFPEQIRNQIVGSHLFLAHLHRFFCCDESNWKDNLFQLHQTPLDFTDIPWIILVYCKILQQILSTCCSPKYSFSSSALDLKRQKKKHKATCFWNNPCLWYLSELPVVL